MSLPYALLIVFSFNAGFKWYILGDTWSRMHQENLFKLNFVYKLWLIPSWWTGHKRATQPLVEETSPLGTESTATSRQHEVLLGQESSCPASWVKRDSFCKRHAWHHRLNETWCIKVVSSAAHQNIGCVRWCCASYPHRVCQAGQIDVAQVGSRVWDTWLCTKAILQLKASWCAFHALGSWETWLKMGQLRF